MYLRLKVTTVSIYHHSVWKKVSFLQKFVNILSSLVLKSFLEICFKMCPKLEYLIVDSFFGAKIQIFEFFSMRHFWWISNTIRQLFMLVGHDKKVFYWLIFLVSEYNIAHCNPSTKEFVATILYFLFVFKSIFRQALANLFMLNSQNRTRLLTSKFPW